MKKISFLAVALAVIIFSCNEDPVNHLPEANNDTNNTSANTPVSGMAQTNDVPSEDGGNAWSLVGENGGAENGSVTMDESGNYTYTPDMNWTGDDVINYQLCDGNGDCVQATITITVSISINDFNDLEIFALTKDGNNKLWVASNNGLYAEVENGYMIVDLGIDAAVTALTYESENNMIWAGTQNGIFKVELGDAIPAITSISNELVSDSHIITAYIDENTTRWFGTKSGFTRNEGEDWQKDMFKTSNGTTSNLSFSSKAITSIGVYNGDYFFATAGLKLWRASNWDESVDAFTSATMWDPPYNGLAISDTMYAVFIDSNGIQWFGGQEGVQGHVGDNPKENNLSFKDELVNENVHCIAEAPNGNIWCGTENGISIGSVSSTGVEWSASTASLTNNFVNAIVFQGNTAWIGTKKGLNKIDL